MSKDILVNVGERETRIAVMEDERLVELHVERSERVVGSIYKCRVVNVLPALDAAFVDIGLERNAFLYVGDVLPQGQADTDVMPVNTRDREVFAQTAPLAREAEAAGDDDFEAMVDGLEELEEEEDDEEGDELLPPFTGEPLSLERKDEEGGATAEGANRRRNQRPVRNFRRSHLRQQKVKDVLKVGQELLVQVIKGSHSTKGARVSTRISLPGRYLVLMPEGDHMGVSRKIEDMKERDRLKRIGDSLNEPGFGLIIRTEAEEKTEQELRQDMDFLMRTWRQIQETAKRVEAPFLVQPDLTLLSKTIRDVFGSDVDKLIIDDPAEYEKANELLERISPKLKSRIYLYDGNEPIFDKYRLEQEIDRLLKRKVFLKSGGSLVLDETEALTVVDVNTSKAVGGASLAETIVRTNIDAATEIARQLRLRDIGGIIVIDFIDMNNPRDKQLVIKALETALKRDRARNKISNISPLGLVEMTRKRTGETLTGFLSNECPYCKGRGHLPSSESVSIDLERLLRRQAQHPQYARKEAFMVSCHPEVAELLIGPDGTTIAEMERELQKAIYVRSNEDAQVEQYQITAGDIAEFEKSRLNYRRAQVVECWISRSLLKETGKCIGWSEGYLLDLDSGGRFVGQKAKARIVDVRRSYAVAQIIPGTNRSADAPV